jgi:hypothetical protein
MPPTRGPAGQRAVQALGDPEAAPDPAWVAGLTGVSERAVTRRFRELDRKAAIARAIHRKQVQGGRDGYAQIRAPLELYAITRILRPDHIVEAGVSSGVSSAYFLMALRSNRRGRLHSIDLPLAQRGAILRKSESPVSLPPGRASGWAVPAGLRKGWDLRIGASQIQLPPLVRELPRIGIFLHDDLHTPAHLAWELETIRGLLRPGSIVLADNGQWTGAAFPEFARSLGARVLTRAGTDMSGLRVP